VDAARIVAHGGRIVSVRLFGEVDGDDRGFEEMQLLGVSRPALQEELRLRFETQNLDGGLVRLVPRAGHGTKPP